MVSHEDASRQSVPIACTLSSNAQTARRAELNRELFSYASDPEELTDGYQWTFPGEAEFVQRLAEFIAFERECCPFLTFELRFEPEQGSIAMRLRGPDGTRAFLESMMGG